MPQNLRPRPHRHQARVTLHAPADELRAASAGCGGTSSRSTTTAASTGPSDDSLDWLAMRIAMLGVDFEVHEPPELVERLRELSGRMARATQTH